MRISDWSSDVCSSDLFVIAQGTVFALRDRHVPPEEVGRILNVDYVVSGSLSRRGKRITVTIELAETRTARIVWTEVFDQKLDQALLVFDEIDRKSTRLNSSH